MIQQQRTDNYIKICMKAWLMCESCVHTENNSRLPRLALLNACAECAKACFAVVSRLVSNADDMGDLPLNCLLHCRQCCEECDNYPDEKDVRACAEICYVCADAVKELAVFSLN